VKWTSWGFLALIGSLVFLVLYLKDRQIRGGVDRLHQMESLPQSALPSPDFPGRAGTRMRGRVTTI
jgi:hypothetical protein